MSGDAPDAPDPGRPVVRPGIPMPATGEERADQRREARRRGWVALVSLPFWLAVGVVDLVVRHRFDVNGLFRPVVALAVLVSGVGTVRHSLRRRAAGVAALPPDPGGHEWAGPAHLSADAAWELRTRGMVPAVGRLCVGPDRLSWSPDETAAAAGHRGWELAPRDLVEVEVSDGRFAPQLRLVRPGRAIAVHLSMASARGLADSLRRNGFTVAD